jgi:hypothetical protein
VSVLSELQPSAMASYAFSPYVTFIESHLIPGATQYAVFHRLTGELIQPSPRIRALLFACKIGNRLSFSDEELVQLGDEGRQIRNLIETRFLISPEVDPLTSFLDHYVTKPLQNPAVTYVSESGRLRLVRLSMAERVYSPRFEDLPPVVEEEMPKPAADLFLAASGEKRLGEVISDWFAVEENPLANAECRKAIEFLTKPERQLIKLTPTTDHLTDPYQPFNTVPRDFKHASRWPSGDAAHPISQSRFSTLIISLSVTPAV